MLCPYAPKDKPNTPALCVEIDDSGNLFVHGEGGHMLQIGEDGDGIEAARALIGALGVVSEQHTAIVKARDTFAKSLTQSSRRDAA